MEQTIKRNIDECTSRSLKGLITFGEVVRILMQYKVESYYADYRSGNITYYMADGNIYKVDSLTPEANIPPELNKSGLQNAIHKAQQDEIRYLAFKKLSSNAGCVGYMVWIAGRQVTYFGRNGEIHIEQFPQ